MIFIGLKYVIFLVINYVYNDLVKWDMILWWYSNNCMVKIGKNNRNILWLINVSFLKILFVCNLKC